MIERSSIEQVMQATDIIDVIGDYVSLKKRGANYLGLCPFHGEKTPSFNVSPSKQIYKCFGCGKAGNAISFLQEHDRLSYVESIRYLAKKYHIDLVETELSDEKKVQIRKEESLSLITQASSHYFHESLSTTEEGKLIGLSYFIERGLHRQTIDEFQLGYAIKEGSAFFKWASEKGFQKELLIELGLISERNGNVYDQYRGRIIFPIQNGMGKVIAFGARILEKNPNAPKYINSPENELYNKSKVLYGLYQARKSISDKNVAILTEGYMDVISLHQAGIKNTVASSGTSLTPDQLKLLKRYTKSIIVLYDSDNAGIKAASRAIDLCLEESFDIHLVILDNGDDPDSFVKTKGGKALEDFIENNKMDFVAFRIQIELQNQHKDINKKSATVDHLAKSLALMRSIEDLTKRADYIKKASALLDVEEQALVLLVNKYLRQDLKKETEKQEKEEAYFEPDLEAIHRQDLIDAVSDHEKLNELALVRILLEAGNKTFENGMSGAFWVFEKLDETFIEDSVIKKFVTEYHQLFDNEAHVDPQIFLYHSDAKITELCTNALYFPYSISKNWERYHIAVPEKEDTQEEDVEKVILYFQLRKIKLMIKEEMEKLLDENQKENTAIILTNLQGLKNMEKDLTVKYGTVIYK